MSRTSLQAALAALVTLPLLSSAPLAFAQEAIMLEQVGAVRMATPTETQRPSKSVETMWFADAQATAYYTLDQGRHEVVARFETGPKGGNPSLVRRTLSDGAVERTAVDGSGQNRIRATLVVGRHGDALSATVETSKRADQASADTASSAKSPTFHLLPVIGAAFTDRRIATNVNEVRSQGGFATAGAVRWLAAAPDENVAGRFYLPAVAGAAYSDARIATSPDEVSRQGGFATAGAVQWLPTASATVEASALKAIKVGAL